MKRIHGVSEDGRKTITFITDDGHESTFFAEIDGEILKDCHERIRNGEKNVFAREIPKKALH